MAASSIMAETKARRLMDHGGTWWRPYALGGKARSIKSPRELTANQAD
jgi:hypothetical protein